MKRLRLKDPGKKPEQATNISVYRDGAGNPVFNAGCPERGGNERTPMGLRTKKDILARLRTSDPEYLFAEAAAVRSAAHGRDVHLRALLETGNICRADCLYCGLRRSNAALARYSLDAEVVVDVACGAVRGGFRSVVLQSGEDTGKPPEFYRDVIASIRERTEAAITLSFGEWPEDAYAMWRKAGADRYLLKFETSNSALYARLRPGRTLDERLACLKILRETGYQVGAGFMVGVPGQTLDDVANDLLLLHALDPDMAGIGPYIPHPGTPLARSCGEGNRSVRTDDPGTRISDSGNMTLRCMAIARIMNPSMHMPATTALEVQMDSGHLKGLSAGANVLMVDITPAAQNRLYEIYPGRRAGNGEDPGPLKRRYEDLLAGEGYTVSPDRGDSLRPAPQPALLCTA